MCKVTPLLHCDDMRQDNMLTQETGSIQERSDHRSPL